MINYQQRVTFVRIRIENALLSLPIASKVIGVQNYFSRGFIFVHETYGLTEPR